MHYWNKQFANMQEVKIKNKDILSIFFESRTFYEKYRLFYDTSTKTFWFARTTPIWFRLIVFIHSVICALFVYSLVLLGALLTLEIFRKSFWEYPIDDFNQYKQEIKNLLFPEKYGQYYSVWVTEASGNKYSILKELLNDETN